MPGLDRTHAPDLTSWVAAANTPDADFPIQNLSFGVFRRAGLADPPRVGVAIGDAILDIGACLRLDLFDGRGVVAARACGGASLNALMQLGPAHWSSLRTQISDLLAASSPALAARPNLPALVLTPMSEAELFAPVEVGDYTDFYASEFHATNVGAQMRPDNPLLPNYKWLPVGYHGRASSLRLSGAPVRRPRGQVKRDSDDVPAYMPSRRLDYELELGFYVGVGNALGEPVPIGQAASHVFGVCLLNDWSARDVQRWEYQPLGPFLAKNFATSISPWVVTQDALAPFRAPLLARPATDPRPLPHLSDDADLAAGALDVTLEVWLSSEKMRASDIAPMRLSRSNARDLYWTPAQMLAHHTSNGCNLRVGDLLGSGTISGADKTARGCLLELTWGGREPIELPSSETRTFLEDGDEVILRGYCERADFRRIGLGECRGVVRPAA